MSPAWMPAFAAGPSPTASCTRTAEAWYENLMGRRREALAALASTYGEAEARKRFQRWRVFFLACAELFGYAHGREWIVAHYRFAAR